jgi:hypothetical protein
MRHAANRPRRPRPGRVETLLAYTGRGILLTVARRLKSPNEFRTWQGEHYESQAWERAVTRVVVSPSRTLFETLAIPDEPLPPGKQARVVIRRLVPNRRCFLRDADNARFMSKPVNDALKRAGYIPGDSKKVLDQPDVQEAVSGDGQHWTQIYIEPVPAGLHRTAAA